MAIGGPLANVAVHRVIEEMKEAIVPIVNVFHRVEGVILSIALVLLGEGRVNAPPQVLVDRVVQ